MLLLRGIWTLRVWVRRVECFKCFIMNHTSRSIEDRGAEGYLNCGGLAQEISEDKNFYKLPKDHSCYSSVKNVAAFCLCLKSLPEANMKSLN